MRILICSLLLTIATLSQETTPDTKVGKAWFKIHQENGGPVAEPLLVPSLPLFQTAGDESPIPDGVTQCEVYSRVVVMDPEKKLKVVLTVLKCDGREFAVSGIVFQGKWGDMSSKPKAGEEVWVRGTFSKYVPEDLYLVETQDGPIAVPTADVLPASALAALQPSDPERADRLVAFIRERDRDGDWVNEEPYDTLAAEFAQVRKEERERIERETPGK
jgi:hypothetical protein